MAAEELKKEELAQGTPLREREKIENPAELLQTSLAGLDKFGGFQLLKGLIKGIDNMNPKRKATKNIFLTDSAYDDARKKLRNELALWLQIFESDITDPMSVIDECQEQRDKAENNLRENLLTIRDEIRNLEVAYRSLDSFFANAGQGKIDRLTIMNIDKSALSQHDSVDTEEIRKELKKNYDNLSLKSTYSLLVIPGYLGDAVTVRMWADTAYLNKVILITDFKDCEDFEDLKVQLDKANIQDQKNMHMANVAMTCNYILGRKKSELAEEEDDLYIPGSAALAGKMSNTDVDDGGIIMSQGAAGNRYGTLGSVHGARLNLLKSEIASIIDFGVIPMVEVDGRTMAFSNRTLYNGGTAGLQEYPIVRTFDWIGKVFMHFFNATAGENWNSELKQSLMGAVNEFLSYYKGPGGLIEKYDLRKIDQDPNTHDIKIEVALKPFFAAKNFLIELTGQRNQDANSVTFNEESFKIS